MVTDPTAARAVDRRAANGWQTTRLPREGAAGACENGAAGQNGENGENWTAGSGAGWQ